MEEFEGKLFKIQNGYLCRGNKRLHRLIWEKFNGPIPKGHHVHHKDGNKLNNSIENLQCLSHSAHLSIHMKENKRLHDWHKTTEGRQALGVHAKEVWKNRKVHTLKCLHCQKDFQAKQIDRAQYCDNKCEQSARRVRGDDLIERLCVICSNPFKINKYHKTITCGYTCGSKYRTRFAKGSRENRVK
jgi:hypothetical protein